MHRLLVSSILIILAGCASAPRGSQSFAGAQTLFDLQPRTEATKAYDASWYAFSNANRLDERDDCYSKGEGSLIQILEMDASGRITGHFADHDDARSKCWRRTYLGVTFPKPPISPYYIRLEMH